MGSFNKNVDKKRWVGRRVVSRKSTTWVGSIYAKMSTIVHLRRVGGRNRVEFGPRSC